MKSRDEAFTLLDHALAAATAAGADAADAFLISGSNALTRFANNTIHQNVATEKDALILRAVMGKRMGVVNTGALSREGIHSAAAKTAEIARSAAEDPDFPGIIGSPAARPVGVFDEETADASPAARADAVGRIIRTIEGGGAVASGAFSTDAFTFAVANTAGTRQYDRGTTADLNVVAMADNAAGTAVFASAKIGDIDAAERAEHALRKCLDSRGAADLEPGEYTVILEPLAVADMLMFLSWLGMGALEMQEGQSCLQGKLGQKIFDGRLTIADDPFDPSGSPFGFDGEGVPKQRVELVKDGVFGRVVYDIRTARKDGTKSTGHGHIPPNPHGPSVGNLFISAGDSTVEQMIASTERGLLVPYFHYTNIAEPSTCTITGMTRYGLFEIRDGRVARPVKNLRFTQSVIEAFNDIAAIGQKRERIGSSVVPAMKINRFRFTGRSDH